MTIGDRFLRLYERVLPWPAYRPRPSLGAALNTSTVWLVWLVSFGLNFCGYLLADSSARTFTWVGRDWRVSAFAVNLELAVRYATLWCGLIVLSRVVTERLLTAGRLGPGRVIAFASVLGIITLGVIDLMNCIVVPWGNCRTGREWLVFRLLAFPRWMTVSAGLMLAWTVAKKLSQYRETQIRADELRAELSRMQIAALQMQLRPHFVFNTLQSVATLVHRDAEAATRMLRGVRQLFASSMSLRDSTWVSLGDEMSLLRAYADIESERFGDNLRVTFGASSDALDAAVPHMLLQPIVENSIHHALTKTEGGTVAVDAHLDDSGRWLMIQVSDDGPGLSGRASGHGRGVGLTNLRARLDLLFGTRCELSLKSAPGQGTTVSLRLPYAVAPTVGPVKEWPSPAPPSL